MRSEGLLPFGDLLAVPLRNGLTRPKAVRGAGTKMVNMGELFAHPRIENAPMDRVPLDGTERKKSLLVAGDLLFARQSLTLEGAGKCSIFVGDTEPVTFESHIIRARLDRQVADPDFFYYYFTSPSGRASVQGIVEQVAAAGIRGRDLAQLKVPVPPVGQQREIAGVLRNLDDRIELNRRMNCTLESIAHIVFKSWFVDFDPVRKKMEGGEVGLSPDLAPLFPDSLTESQMGPVPQGWPVVPLSTLVAVNPKYPLARGSRVPYVEMRGLPTDAARVTQWRVRQFTSGSRFRNGDVLVARITPCLENGKTALVDFLEQDEVAWGSTEFLVLRPQEPIPTEYVYCLTRSDAFRDYAVGSMNGSSGRQRVPVEALERLPVVRPPDGLLGAFGHIAHSAVDLMAANDRQSQSLVELRDSLIPKLLCGIPTSEDRLGPRGS